MLDRASMELSARRTGMSFQHTRMSADRTLMSVIRTSLSLISFGFTIAQVFQKHKSDVMKISAQSSYPHSLPLLRAIVLLVLGVVAKVGVTLGVGPLG